MDGLNAELQEAVTDYLPEKEAGEVLACVNTLMVLVERLQDDLASCREKNSAFFVREDAVRAKEEELTMREERIRACEDSQQQ